MRMRFHLGLAASFTMVLSACGDGTDTASEGEILGATENEKERKSGAMAFGLAVFPDARIVMSTPEGRAMQIESSASRAAIAEFYKAELERHGYALVSVEESAERTRVKGVLKNDDGNVVQISISPAESGPNRYSIIALSRPASSRD